MPQSYLQSGSERSPSVAWHYGPSLPVHSPLVLQPLAHWRWAPSPSDVSGWATHQRRSSTVGRLEVDELVIGGRSVSAEDIGPVPGRL